MKKHILFNYKTNSTETSEKESTVITFAVENSDRDDSSFKGESTRITEAVETSDITKK